MTASASEPEPGRSLLGDLGASAPAPVTEAGFIVTLKSGESVFAFDPDTPAGVYSRPLESVWGRRVVLFADGSLVVPDEIAAVRPARRDEYAISARDAVGGVKSAAAELKDALNVAAVAAEAVSGPVQDDEPRPGDEDYVPHESSALEALNRALHGLPPTPTQGGPAS